MATFDQIGWNEHWTSLKAEMETWVRNFPDSANSGVYQKATLSCLVDCLCRFSEDQFKFFFDGFKDSGQLKVSPKDYPPEYAFSLTLDQVAFDFEVIQNATFQRLQGSPEAKTTLRVADQLAWLALEPAVDAKLFESMPAVVTYFQKSASIRLIPYAPVALIGIPLSCIDHPGYPAYPSHPRDYLAVFHEIGHYVYRHGRMPAPDGPTVEKAVSDSIQSIPGCPNYIKNWQEEIFADIYGCIVGGPVLALDFQDLQLEKSGEKFIEDDGEHPIPFLRPSIYKTVLGLLNVPKEQVSALNTDWDRKTQGRDSTSELHAKSGNLVKGTAAITNFDKIINTLWPLMDKVREALESPPTASWVLPNPPTQWPRDVGFSIGNETPYKQFGEYVTYIKDKGEDPDPGSAPQCTCISRSKWAEKEGFDLTSPEIGDLKNEPPDGWIHVLKAKGWATKWPQSVK